MKWLLTLIFSMFIPYSVPEARSDHRFEPPHIDSLQADSIKADRKELFKAYGISFLGTALPLSVTGGIVIFDQESGGELPGIFLLFGSLLGPSLGEFYLKPYSTPSIGILIRTAGIGLIGIGAIQNFNAAGCGVNSKLGDLSPNSDSNKNCNDEKNGNGLIYAGTGVILSGIVYSLFDIHSSVIRVMKATGKNKLTLTPIIAPEKDVTIKTGLMACLKF